MSMMKTIQCISTAGIGLFYLLGIATPAVAADVTLEITNIETAQGKLQIAIYNNKDEFAKRQYYRAISKPAVKGKLEVTLTDLPAGEYGVMLYQDINSNDALDSNLLGIPKEPWSASLQGRSVFGAPGWDDIKFTLNDDGNRIVIDML